MTDRKEPHFVIVSERPVEEIASIIGGIEHGGGVVIRQDSPERRRLKICLLAVQPEIELGSINILPAPADGITETCLREKAKYCAQTRIEFRGDAESEYFHFVWTLFYEVAFNVQGWNLVSTYPPAVFANLPGDVIECERAGLLIDQQRLDAFIEKRP